MESNEKKMPRCGIFLNQFSFSFFRSCKTQPVAQTVAKTADTAVIITGDFGRKSDAVKGSFGASVSTEGASVSTVPASFAA